MTITQMAASLRSGEKTCTALVQAALDAASSEGKRLNAFITLLPDSAIERARALDSELKAGKNRGPLHGVPVAVKDNLYIKGTRTTSGSKVLSDFVAAYDATSIAKLEAAGAVIIGKTNLHELAYGITSTNPHYGAVHNPRRFECIPGGSSGGSAAAVAAGIVPLALGTDTGGSIRTPASYCGTVGLKPTYGRVSRYGCQALGLSLDHVGPISTTLEDAAIALNAMAGWDVHDETTARRAVPDYVPAKDSRPEPIRVGWPVNFYMDGVDSRVAAALGRARESLRDSGAAVQEVRVPNIAELNAVARVVLLCEATAVMQRHLVRRDEIGPDVMALLDQGRFVPGVDYVNAQRARRIYVQQFRELFRNIDVLLTPTTPIVAPEIGQATVQIEGQTEDVRLASTRMVRGINAIGYPALSVPCGDAGGLPVGLQIIGRPFEEAQLLRVAARLPGTL